MSTKLNRILIVEDNEDDLELTIDALKDQYTPNDLDIVRDGAEAIDYLFCMNRWAGRDRGNPDVIFLDLKLPKISGLEVLEKIRTHAKTKTIPVVIFTSSNQETDISTGYTMGANAYVVKPVEYPGFVATIKQLGTFWGSINQSPESPALNPA